MVQAIGRSMSTESVNKIDLSLLADVSAFLLETNTEVASGMRTMLRGVGLTGIKTFASAEALETNLKDAPPDILILSESERSNLFEITKKVHRGTVGRNPFTLVLLLVLPDNPASKGAALKSGADSALVKPVASAQLIGRVSHLAFNRPPFIATTDYIGPERRHSRHPSEIPLIQTINTLRYKLERKTISPAALEKAIASTMTHLWLGQLKSHSLKLQWSSNVIFERQRTGHSQSEVKEDLLKFVIVLEEATVTAQRIDQPDMLKTCHDLVKEIKLLAGDAGELDDHKIKMIALIASNFEQSRQSISPKT